MLENLLYQKYAGQIAILFCKDANLTGLCKMNVRLRIIKNFTDSIFENSFLPSLDSARFFALSFTVSRTGTHFKYTISGKDIVTGKTKNMLIDGIPANRVEDVAWVFNWKLNDWYDRNNVPYHAEYLGVVGNKHVLQITMPNNYGIIFVPSSVSGNGSTGGQGTDGNGAYNGGNGIFYKPPAVMPGDPDPLPILTGFDLKSLLIPGAVLVALYYLS